MNTAGIKNKKCCTIETINAKHAQVFTIQETHLKRKGTFSMPGYRIFEAIRDKKSGGSMIGVDVNLDPHLVESCEDDLEIIVVQLKINNSKMRIITGYGPQENVTESEALNFFTTMEKYVIEAQEDKIPVVLSFDTNCKLGCDYIPGDPHKQSRNGGMLANLIDEQNLRVANGLTIAKGVITRQRTTKNSVEKSAIDMVILSEELVEKVVSINIDEKKEFPICGVVVNKNKIVEVETDHNVIETKLKIKWKIQNEEKRTEVFNYKNKECQRKFRDDTTRDDKLSRIFLQEDENLDTLIKRFMKELKNKIYRNFKKIRINDKKVEETQMTKLIDQRTKLKNLPKNQDNLKRIEEINEELAKLCGEKNFEKLKKTIGDSNEDSDQIVNIWELKKILIPKNHDEHTMMLDKETGKIEDDKEKIVQMAKKVFKERLTQNKEHEDMKEIRKNSTKLFLSRMKITRNKTTPEWNHTDLEEVLKKLKKNKAKDPNDMPNELFTDTVAGGDLKKAMLMILNRIKKTGFYPENMKIANVTCIYKKGAKKDFDNYRGIFRLTVIRNVLDRIIYNDSKETIDQALTDSNVGARAGRNIRDNILVVEAIINSIKRGNSREVDIQIMDVVKCFDKLNMVETINDLYDLGFRDERLQLIYLGGRGVKINVKTMAGETGRFELCQEVVMQGGVWGSLQCTATMDKMGKDSYENTEEAFKYKNEVHVPPLGMVDDMLTITECGPATVKMNAKLNTFMEHKNLELAEKKCSRIHIGKRKSSCPENLKVHSTKMKNSKMEKYLGDYVSEKGDHWGTIRDRKRKAQAATTIVNIILDESYLGHRRIEVAIMLRTTILTSTVLTNTEAWHNITKHEIEALERIDNNFLRNILKTHSSIGLAFLHLELGTLPIRYTIMNKRLTYFHHLINRKNTELTSRILEEQRKNPTKGDLIPQIHQDMIKIDMEDEEEFRKMKKKRMKNIVKEKIQKLALTELVQTNSKLKKTNLLEYKTLQIKEYLISPRLTNKQRNLLLSIRSRTLKLKSNFRRMYGEEDLSCTLGCGEPEDQIHILQCTKLLSKEQIQTANYEALLGDDLEGIVENIKIFEEAIDRKKRIEEEIMSLKQDDDE